MSRYRTPHQMPAAHGAARIEDVAAELGVSRERARQIERIALAKARAVLTERGLTLDHFLDAVRAQRPNRAVDQASSDGR